MPCIESNTEEEPPATRSELSGPIREWCFSGKSRGNPYTVHLSTPYEIRRDSLGPYGRVVATALYRSTKVTWGGWCKTWWRRSEACKLKASTSAADVGCRADTTFPRASGRGRKCTCPPALTQTTLRHSRQNLILHQDRGLLQL